MKNCKKNISDLLLNLQGFKKSIPSFLILHSKFLILHSTFLISIFSAFAQIDEQTYNYTGVTNQLSSISDAASDGVSTIDIDNQASANYAYDAKGQLTKDEAEGILSITWTAAGKVKEVTYADRGYDRHNMFQDYQKNNAIAAKRSFVMPLKRE